MKQQNSKYLCLTHLKNHILHRITLEFIDVTFTDDYWWKGLLNNMFRDPGAPEFDFAIFICDTFRHPLTPVFQSSVLLFE